MIRVPDEPITLPEVVAMWPRVRQSLLANYDDCGLSAYFTLRYANGWSTTPQARGTIFHRTAARMLETMRAAGHETMPPREAVQILMEVCRQQDVPAKEIVRVPLRQMPELRMAVEKFARDNRFSIRKIVDVEKTLEAPIAYSAADGSAVIRTLTGKLDLLLFEPPDGAIVLDWKDTFGLPPEPRDAPQGYDDEELKGLSFHGYFQQRFYGYLVMRNFSNVHKVTLREFYARKTVVRRATLHRHQMPDVEQELSMLVEAFDQAIAQGSPARLLRGDEAGVVDIDKLGWWKPAPGRHCGFCVRPTMCPIEDDVRVAAGGAVTSQESASRWAARWQKAERIRQVARDGLKGLVETSGSPVPVKWSKGRRVIGWYQTKNGRRFGMFTPDTSDRGGHADLDEQLKEAMRESTVRARVERGVKPRRRRRA